MSAQKRTSRRVRFMFEPWQELSDAAAALAAVMCPACLCGREAAGHNALRGLALRADIPQ
jgi:hypothetical protein